MPDQSLNKVNKFLAYRDVSPVRHELSVPWDDDQECTKHRYTSKQKESIQEVLEAIAPGQSKQLWAAVGDNVPAERSQAEIELLKALAESYLSLEHKKTNIINYGRQDTIEGTLALHSWHYLLHI